MSDRLTVAALPSTVEAELIRGKLAAAGIDAVLVEPVAGDSPQRGVGGRVQVQVGPADFERAMQLLFPIPTLARGGRAPAPPAWKCPKCGEEVRGDSSVCWSCGANREAAAASRAPASPAPASPAPASPAPVTPRAGMPLPPAAPAGFTPPDPTASAAPPGHGYNHRRFNLPQSDGIPLVLPAPVPRSATGSSDLQMVVPPLDAGALPSSAAEARRRAKSDPTVANDRAARRAWWTAAIGLVGLPILWPLLLYSAAVVLALGLLNRPLSRRGARFFYGALGLNALAVAVVFAFLALRQ
ncbi:MAG TPA: zinc ribbon domain-containing protein [Pirellulales bacterium]|nr:zinc ribbon domain-containing protein [Pirellulales bacterium]